MTPTPEVQATLRRYLLGQLDNEAREQVEKDLLTHDEIYQELLIVEDEIVDGYLEGKLQKVDRSAFETHFLATAARKKKFRFGRAFKRHVVAQSGNAAFKTTPNRKLVAIPGPWRLSGFFPSSPLAIVTGIVILIAVGFGVWRVFIYQSPVDQGLLALNSAYREQRPFESRISYLSYAPFSQTRGGPSTVDSLALARADAILSSAAAAPNDSTAQHAVGEVYLAKKQFDLAIKAFEQALKADPRNGRVYSDLGAAWLEKGKIDVEKANADAAGVLAGQGMEELGRSLEYLNKGLELDHNLVEALFNRALCHQSLKQYRQAEDDWREYLKRDPNSAWANEANQRLRELQKQNDTSSQRNPELLQKFFAAYQSRDGGSAWAALSRSRERKGNLIVEGLLDEYLIFVTTNQPEAADVRLQMLEYAARIEKVNCDDQFTTDLVSFYRKATPAQRELSLEARRVAKAANQLYSKPEFEEALALYPKAIQLFQQADNECEALLMESWIGYCYLRIPKVQEAHETLTRLSKIYEQKHYRSMFAQSCYALSDARFTVNEFSQALDYARRSLSLSEAIDDRANVVRSHGQILSVQLQLASYRQALSSVLLGLDSAESSVFDPTLVWHLYHEASLAYYALGLNSAAFDCETEAERLAEISNNHLLRARTLDRLALLFDQTGNSQKAVRLLNQSLAEAESISGESSRGVTQVHTTLALGEVCRKMSDFTQAIANFDRTVNLSKQLNNLEFYLYQAHKGKLLALISLHDDLAAEAELDTVVSLFEEYRQKIADESYRNRFFDNGQNTYDVAVDFEYSRQHDFEKAFDLAEVYRARSLFESLNKSLSMTDASGGSQNIVSDGKPLSHIQLQSQISDQVQLLEYTVLDDKVLMWVVTRSGVKHADTNVSAADLEREVEHYRDVLTRSHLSQDDSLNGLAKELYAKLIAPLEERGYLSRDLELCIVPDKMLNFLPFAALISPSSGQYLIQTYALQIAPSATIFVKASENASLRDAQRRESLLAVGDPRFDEIEFANLPELPAAKREAQKVSEFYNSPTLLLGPEATAARVKQVVANADVIHFATHAILDDESPLLSKLLLAKGGASESRGHHVTHDYLQASEIYDLKLPLTRLVVLSACQTGIEQAYRGEGSIGLARPFMAVGVPLVVASLWPVDSSTTATLMISFHSHRTRDKVSTAAALRQAQLEMLSNADQNLRAPYAWAAFVSIGGYARF